MTDSSERFVAEVPWHKVLDPHTITAVEEAVASSSAPNEVVEGRSEEFDWAEANGVPLAPYTAFSALRAVVDLQVLNDRSRQVTSKQRPTLAELRASNGLSLFFANQAVIYQGLLGQHDTGESLEAIQAQYDPARLRWDNLLGQVARYITAVARTRAGVSQDLRQNARQNAFTSNREEVGTFTYLSVMHWAAELARSDVGVEKFFSNDHSAARLVAAVALDQLLWASFAMLPPDKRQRLEERPK